MAKSSRRPVDKVERGQRLAQKLAKNFDDRVNRNNLMRHTWLNPTEDEVDDEPEHNHAPRLP